MKLSMLHLSLISWHVLAGWKDLEIAFLVTFGEIAASDPIRG